jgi:Tfp pilus assembly protein PilX
MACRLGPGSRQLPEGRPFAVALTMMLVIALIGLVAAVLVPERH